MIIDLFLFIVAGWGFYQGFTRGIIKTVFTAFSVVFGLMAAFKLSPAATRFLETAFSTDSPFTFIAGFLMAFFLTMIIIRLIAGFFEKILESANINVINKFAGGVLLASIYTLIFSLLVWFGDQSHIITQEVAAKSYSHGFLRAFPGKMKGVYEYVKPAFRDFWRESVTFMDKMQEKSLKETESQPTIFDIPDEEKKKPDE